MGSAVLTAASTPLCAYEACAAFFASIGAKSDSRCQSGLVREPGKCRCRRKSADSGAENAGRGAESGNGGAFFVYPMSGKRFAWRFFRQCVARVERSGFQQRSWSTFAVGQKVSVQVADRCITIVPLRRISHPLELDVRQGRHVQAGGSLPEHVRSMKRLEPLARRMVPIAHLGCVTCRLPCERCGAPAAYRILRGLTLLSRQPIPTAFNRMKEKADDVIKDFVDFMSRQRGVYIDAMAGFAGHEVRIEQQIARVIRPSERRIGEDEIPIVMMSSYEDPTKPDVIHSRIVRTKDYISDNSELGFNAQQQAYALIAFILAYWEHETRVRLAAAQSVELNEIKSDIFGDLREIRHSILHTKAILRRERYNKLKIVQSMFEADMPILITFEKMHKLFEHMHQGCAKLLIELMGIPDCPVDISQMTGLAIMKSHRPR